MKNLITDAMLHNVESMKARSAWARGVKLYAVELLYSLDRNMEDGSTGADVTDDARTLEKALLNGARTWEEYSYGGGALVYDRQIARRLCNVTELKRTHGGERFPNTCENWLDVQARALHQAAALVLAAAAAAGNAAKSFQAPAA